MKIVERIQVTVTHTIPDVIEEKLKKYVSDNEKELRVYRYHEKLEQAFTMLYGDLQTNCEDVLDWYIKP